MRKRLGCLSTSGVVAAVVTLVAVAAASLLWGGLAFSPGPLNAQAGQAPLNGVDSHADIGGRCTACHPTPWSAETVSDRCLACHLAVQGELDAASGLHGALAAQEQALPCYGCHPEHQGAEAPLTVVDAQSFPHTAVGYSLQGHVEMPDGRPFECSDCHGEDVIRFDPAICVDCHRDLDPEFAQAHVQAFGEDCLACHHGTGVLGTDFDHNRLDFGLEGEHAALACIACHAGARTLDDLRAAPQECVACHQDDDAHEGQFGQDCGQCHTPVAWEEATFDHDATAFPLTGAHTDTDCTECHRDGAYQGTPQECVACHEDPAYHAGLFGTDCASCHTTGDWAPASYDRPHQFPTNHGESGPSPCQTCHPDNLDSYTCYGCHEHERLEVQQKHREEGIQDFQDCMRCHPTGQEEEGGEGEDD
jgi:hypothetical protein